MDSMYWRSCSQDTPWASFQQDTLVPQVFCSYDWQRFGHDARMMQQIRLRYINWKHFLTSTCIHCSCTEFHKFWSLLQCTVPESAATVLSPVSGLFPGLQPELPQLHSPHCASPTISTFPKPCPLGFENARCFVSHPEPQSQNLSGSQDDTNPSGFSLRSPTTVLWMPSLSG